MNRMVSVFAGSWCCVIVELNYRFCKMLWKIAVHPSLCWLSCSVSLGAKIKTKCGLLYLIIGIYFEKFWRFHRHRFTSVSDQ